MYSWEDLLDLENEKYMVSVFYLGRSQRLLLFILDYLSTGTNSSCSAWGPSVSCLKLKTKHTTQKLRPTFYSVYKAEDLTLGHSISGNSERLL